jgi:thiol:disulfide interchange protein
MRKSRLILSLAALLAATPGLATPAPRIGTGQIQQPLPIPYAESANAAGELTAARKLARAQHKLLLVDLGGNWCLDCRVLAGVMEIPAVHSFITRHYVVVSVDIGRRDKNLQIPERYGVDIRGVPAVLIVDPKTDRLRNPGNYAALSDARSMTPQALVDWLAQWVA